MESGQPGSSNEGEQQAAGQKRVRSDDELNARKKVRMSNDSEQQASGQKRTRTDDELKNLNRCITNVEKMIERTSPRIQDGQFAVPARMTRFAEYGIRMLMELSQIDYARLPDLAKSAREVLMRKYASVDGETEGGPNPLIAELLRYMLDGSESRTVEALKAILDQEGVHHGIQRQPPEHLRAQGRATDVVGNLMRPESIKAFADGKEKYVEAQQRRRAELQAEVARLQAEVARLDDEVARLDDEVAAVECISKTHAARECMRDAQAIVYDEDMEAYTVTVNMLNLQDEYREEMLRNPPPVVQ